ncbi:hypothetical protein JNUCC1_01029 [Lentibacillus sp. JNUCC-1]|nr:hypothetical protein [Lentibacillus sp. JNUCC-1]
MSTVFCKRLQDGCYREILFACESNVISATGNRFNFITAQVRHLFKKTIFTVSSSRGHGLSLLAPARGMSTLPAKGGFSRPSLMYSLWGLRTRAVPAGVDYPSLQSLYPVWRIYIFEVAILAEGKYEDSSGRISLGETPERDSVRRLSSAHGKRSVFPERSFRFIF